MSRARAKVDVTQVVTTYRMTRSVRATARQLRLDRWLVRARLEEVGEAVLTREHALENHWAMARLEDPAPICRWPRCSLLAEIGGLCRGHAEAVPEFAQRCAWPGCEQMPFSGALCGPHLKRAREVS